MAKIINALMCECVNAIVGLIGMVERGDLWNRKGSPRDRRAMASAWPTRATDLGGGVKISNLPSCMVYMRSFYNSLMEAFISSMI